MANIIRVDHGPRYSGTQLEFPEGDAALQAYYAATYIEPNSPIRVSWHSGNPIPPEVLPTRVRVLKGKGPFDWAQVGTPVLVSAAFRHCVEQLNPGQHGFFPVTMEEKDGTPRPDPFYLFNVVGRIDAIIEAKSNLKPVGRGQISGWGYTRRTGPWHCALDRTVIGNRACWVDIRYTHCWFVSDRLANLLKKHRLFGFDLDEYCAELDPD